jgi:Phage Tail Collar Domain
MADEIVYRLLQGDGVQIVEDAVTKTVTIGVPGLQSKVNIGDIVDASEVNRGIIELATSAEVQAGTDAQRAITPAGLRAASQANATDNTAGRLLRAGAFGLGDSVVLSGGSDLNTVIRSGFYRLSSPHVNSPAGADHGHMIVSRGGDTITQLVITYTGAATYFRGGNPAAVGGSGSWSPWRAIHHSGNFDPASKANTSGYYPGLDVGNAGTVGGNPASYLAPAGMVAHFATSAAPTGWLKANGAVVSRSTYVSLFSAIGTFYGAGNGSTTFNLPDLRGEFLRCWDDGRGWLDPGRSFGSTQATQNQWHWHTGSTSYGGDHQHAQGSESLFSDYGGGGHVRNANFSGGGFALYRNQLTSLAGGHTHSVSTNGDGGNEARPHNIALLACIKY